MKDEVLSKHTLSSSVKTRPAFNNIKPKDWYFVLDQVQLRTGLECVRLKKIILDYNFNQVKFPEFVLNKILKFWHSRMQPWHSWMQPRHSGTKPWHSWMWPWHSQKQPWHSWKAGCSLDTARCSIGKARCNLGTAGCNLGTAGCSLGTFGYTIN